MTAPRPSLLFSGALLALAGPAAAQTDGHVPHRLFRAGPIEPDGGPQRFLELAHFDPYGWLMDAVALEGDRLSVLVDVSKHDVEVVIDEGVLDVAVLRGAGDDLADYPPLDLVAVLRPEGLSVVGWDASEVAYHEQVVANQSSWADVTEIFSGELAGVPTVFGFAPGTPHKIRRLQVGASGPEHLTPAWTTDIEVLDGTTLHWYATAAQRTVTAVVGASKLRVYDANGLLLLPVNVPETGTSEDRIVELAHEPGFTPPTNPASSPVPRAYWLTQDLNSGTYVGIGLSQGVSQLEVAFGQDTELSSLGGVAVADLSAEFTGVADGWHDLTVCAGDLDPDGNSVSFSALRDFQGPWYFLSWVYAWGAPLELIFGATDWFQASPATQLAFGDVDNDGDLDTFAAHDHGDYLSSDDDYYSLTRGGGWHDHAWSPVTEFLGTSAQTGTPPDLFENRRPHFEIWSPAALASMPAGVELRVEVFDLHRTEGIDPARRFAVDLSMPAANTSVDSIADVPAWSVPEDEAVQITVQAVLKNAAGDAIRYFPHQSYLWTPHVDMENHLWALYEHTRDGDGGGNNTGGTVGGGQGSGNAGNDPPVPRD